VQNKWKGHGLLPVPRMKQKEWMFIWELKGRNSNGHGEEIDREGNIRKIIEGFQKDAQTRREDNIKLIKAQEKQGEFNIKLLKSLERIEKKLDKESDSSRTGSHSMIKECWLALQESLPDCK
jgi:hypothetical protein